MEETTGKTTKMDKSVFPYSLKKGDRVKVTHVTGAITEGGKRKHYRYPLNGETPREGVFIGWTVLHEGTIDTYNEYNDYSGGMDENYLNIEKVIRVAVVSFTDGTLQYRAPVRVLPEDLAPVYTGPWVVRPGSRFPALGQNMRLMWNNEAAGLVVEAVD